MRVAASDAHGWSVDFTRSRDTTTRQGPRYSECHSPTTWSSSCILSLSVPRAHMRVVSLYMALTVASATVASSASAQSIGYSIVPSAERIQ